MPRKSQYSQKGWKALKRVCNKKPTKTQETKTKTTGRYTIVANY
jgi:hypothetical protein